MSIKVNAVNIIENLIPEVDEIQCFHENVPKGAFIGEHSEYRRLYDRMHDAERKFSFASDLTGINENALYQAVLIARRWYTKTGWQNCLTDDTADRLLKCMIEQNEKNARYNRIGGNEYLLFMNEVISNWARKSRKKNNDVA